MGPQPPRGHDPHVARTMREYQQLEQRLHALVRDFHGSPDEGRREAIRNEIVEITEAQFELKHAMREQELQRLREQMEAVAEVREVIDRSIEAGVRPVAEFMFLKGELLRRGGQLEEARLWFGKTLEDDPAHPGALLGMAQVILEADQGLEVRVHAGLLPD